LRYEILGPLRIVDDNGPHSIAAKKMQAALALMLILHDQVVSTERLIYEIWRDRPPRRSMAGIHVYVSHLRKLLARPSDQAECGNRNRIVTTSSGYMLRLGCDAVDFEDFRAGVEAGKEHYRAHRHQEAMASFDDALRLWRGTVLDEIREGPVVNGFVVRHEEMRLECIELLLSSALSLGKHREIVGYLYSLVQDHPLHEDFYQKLMFALYRSGRRADALRVYQSARDTLRSELGLEPSRPLRQLHQKILVADSWEAATRRDTVSRKLTVRSTSGRACDRRSR
jgi:SARP family transcriptional regulator, regulator of embCAB operon